jgi:protein SCO1/2
VEGHHLVRCRSPAAEAGAGRRHSVQQRGDRDQIYSLARDTHFSNDDRLRATLTDASAVLHTDKLVLVDRQGQLRGVYNGTQPFEIDHLIEDAQTLLSEQ